MAEKPRVQWFSSANDISPSLWLECFPKTLEGGWWYHVLDRSGLGDQFTFYYGLVTCGGKGIGIAPAFVMNVPIDIVTPPTVTKLLLAAGRFWPSLRYQRTLFIGSPCSDQGTVGLCPGVRLSDVSIPLQNAVETLSIREGANMIVWKDFPDESVSELNNLINSRNMFTIPSFPETVVPLPDGNFETYLATLTSGHRHNLRKKLRKSKAIGDLQSAVIQRPDAAEIAEIFDLFMQTYSRGKVKFERLGKLFFQQISLCEETHFITLRLPETGRMTAFMLCFRLGRKVINKFIGLDYTLNDQWFMYFRLWEAAVDWAMSIGAAELQSGQTGYRAKLDMGHRLMPLTNVCMNRNGVLHELFSLAAKSVTWETLDPDLKSYVVAQTRKGHR
ncbi:MAG TPA: GNAT family N-acetyltransferase [Phycisphaerae bacterium]|nr:GNAT family N-acetyltransferase [Phycisphaerae bacterium]